MKPKLKTKSKYIPGLDGLRALAVLSVIAYHMGAKWAPGGLLGVTIFFVISGYLITSLLLIEWDNTHTINLPQFWLRRIRRLFPAILLVVVVSAALFTFFNHSLFTKLREDMWAALFWFTNWWYIVRDVSYFDALGAPSPLTHFWSLAIEEQFYLIWPVVLLLAHRFGMKRETMRNATLVLVGISVLEMAILFNPTGDSSRVYYGTDTRAFSLLIGAVLAFVWPSNALGAKSETVLSSQGRLMLDAVGVVALAGLVLMVAVTNGFSPFLYRGGLLLASLLSAVVIAVLVHPASLLSRALGCKPLVWVGLRSYGIYLWHYPIILLTTSANNISGTPWWVCLLQLAVILVVSDLSYRFVENPIRRGAIGKLFRGVRQGSVSFFDWLRDHAIRCGFCVLALFIAVIGLVTVPDTSALEGGDLLKDESAHVAGTEGGAVLDVLMIGDSVSVRAIPDFQNQFPYGAIDAAVSRQLYAAQDIYAAYDEQGIVGDVVVFALGTNGVVTIDQLDELIALVGDKHIFFVNTRSNQDWVDDTNEALAQAAEKYENVELIDWYAYSANGEDWFDGDGTHLTSEGAAIYIGMIYDAISPLLPVHDADDEAVVFKSDFQRASEFAVQEIERASRSVMEGIVRYDAPQED